MNLTSQLIFIANNIPELKMYVFSDVISRNETIREKVNSNFNLEDARPNIKA